jgi:putative endonuclease
MQQKFYYVYILFYPDKKVWYTGCTNDLKKRIHEHKSGLSTWTRHRGEFILAYYEACLSQRDAYAREKYLKSGMGKRFIKNRLKTFFEQ